MTSVYELTERVKELVPNAPGEALTAALTIEPPAARIYALAWIIRHAPGSVVRQALNEAEAAARTETHPAPLLREFRRQSPRFGTCFPHSRPASADSGSHSAETALGPASSNTTPLLPPSF